VACAMHCWFCTPMTKKSTRMSQTWTPGAYVHVQN
jgi:hypothetical protein